MSRFAVKEADFKLFLVLWNQRQGLLTPDLHFRMADWLEQRWRKGEQNLLLMAFRSSGKSTLVGLFAAWLLYRNPELRILVLAADFTLARKMVRNVKRIIERHPLTKKMKPDAADQWASDRFTVRRMIELRDPSMLAKGVTSNITGSRADVIICDDVEVPNTSDTAEKRRELRERLAEISYVLTPGGTQIYIGTPHTYYSIYAEEARAEIGEEKAFLPGFTRLHIPLLDDKGESAWPERFTDYEIARQRTQTGPNKFASQMLLRPMNIAEGRLDPALLQVYDDALDYTRELQTLFLGERKMISASAWWDPAFGAGRGDRSVVAIVYADAEGNLYAHRVEYISISSSSRPRSSGRVEGSPCSSHDRGRSLGFARDDGGVEIDEATQQCRIVAQLAKEHFLPCLSIETNGIGKFLPAMLRNEMARAHVPCRVQEIHSSKNKDLRILEAFDAPMAAHRLHVHRAVLQTPLMTEMQEWRPGSSKGHDDGLDAVAGALSQQPLRIERLYGQGGHSWMRTGQPGKAKTEFEV